MLKPNPSYQPFSQSNSIQGCGTSTLLFIFLNSLCLIGGVTFLWTFMQSAGCFFLLVSWNKSLDFPNFLMTGKLHFHCFYQSIYSYLLVIIFLVMVSWKHMVMLKWLLTNSFNLNHVSLLMKAAIFGRWFKIVTCIHFKILWCFFCYST